MLHCEKPFTTPDVFWMGLSSAKFLIVPDALIFKTNLNVIIASAGTTPPGIVAKRVLALEPICVIKDATIQFKGHSTLISLHELQGKVTK